MRKGYLLVMAASGMAAAAIVPQSPLDGLASAANAGAPSATHHGPNDVPVVVELFTSEGCSSCPPADDVLARLEQTQPVEGARVIPLAFHVDYWDELGWPDLFASPSFTARQRVYAKVDGRMYTPQAVVDGSTELVGSRKNALEQAIRKAKLRPHTTVSTTIRRNGGGLEVSVRVAPLPRNANVSTGASAAVAVALTQAEATVVVSRGENGGRTLRHTAIVRDVESAGTVNAEGGQVRGLLRVPAGVPDTALRVIALVQRTDDREIVGSTVQTVSR